MIGERIKKRRVELGSLSTALPAAQKLKKYISS